MERDEWNKKERSKVLSSTRFVGQTNPTRKSTFFLFGLDPDRSRTGLSGRGGV